MDIVMNNSGARHSKHNETQTRVRCVVVLPADTRALIHMRWSSIVNHMVKADSTLILTRKYHTVRGFVEWAFNFIIVNKIFPGLSLVILLSRKGIPLSRKSKSILCVKKCIFWNVAYRLSWLHKTKRWLVYFAPKYYHLRSARFPYQLRWYSSTG